MQGAASCARPSAKTAHQELPNAKTSRQERASAQIPHPPRVVRGAGDLSTKMLETGIVARGRTELVLTLTAPAQVGAYQLYTANDNIQRDPASRGPQPRAAAPRRAVQRWLACRDGPPPWLACGLAGELDFRAH